MSRTWLSLAAAVSVAYGGQSQPGEAKFPVCTSMVEVDVVVKDKSGKAVGGLTRDNFTITDSGRVQKIAGFSVVTAAAGGSASSPSAPAGVYTNRARPGESPQRSLVILLLDRLNCRMREFNSVQQKLAAYFRKTQPGTQVGVVALEESGALKVLAEITSDSEKIASAILAEPARASQLQRMTELDDMDRGDTMIHPDDNIPEIKRLNQRVAESANRTKMDRTLEGARSSRTAHGARSRPQEPGMGDRCVSVHHGIPG
jgi:VWFA-related protein